MREQQHVRQQHDREAVVRERRDVRQPRAAFDHLRVVCRRDTDVAAAEHRRDGPVQVVLR